MSRSSYTTAMDFAYELVSCEIARATDDYAAASSKRLLSAMLVPESSSSLSRVQFEENRELLLVSIRCRARETTRNSERKRKKQKQDWHQRRRENHPTDEAEIQSRLKTFLEGHCQWTNRVDATHVSVLKKSAAAHCCATFHQISMAFTALGIKSESRATVAAGRILTRSSARRGEDNCIRLLCDSEKEEMSGEDACRRCMRFRGSSNGMLLIQLALATCQRLQGRCIGAWKI